MDDLIGRVRRELSVEPSPEFARRVRDAAARQPARSRLAWQIVPAMAALAVVFTGLSWWIDRTSPTRFGVPPDRTSQADRLAGTELPRPAISAPQAAEQPPMTAVAVAVRTGAPTPRRPATAGGLDTDPATPEPAPSATRIALERVGTYQVPMWTVQPAEPFSTVAFAAPPVATVEFTRVEFQPVILPALDITTPAPPRERGGREQP